MEENEAALLPEKNHKRDVEFTDINVVLQRVYLQTLTQKVMAESYREICLNQSIHTKLITHK